MPSPLPSTFASAAAGNTQDSSSSIRRDGLTGASEWSRNRPNGATQTFRRSSLATNASHSRENAQPASSISNPPSSAYIPPHLSSNFQPSQPRSGGDGRYSKEQLLSLYKNQRESKGWGKSVSSHFLTDFDLDTESERTSANGTWGKRDDLKESHTGLEVCWDRNGDTEPLGLVEMDDEEKDVRFPFTPFSPVIATISLMPNAHWVLPQLFSNSVNSPLKPPPQNSNKDGAATGPTLGRKSSISHSHAHIGSFNTPSPASARTANRRRGTGDSGGNTMSPTHSRFFRDEPNTATPPPSLLRRKTDFRESSADIKLEEKEKSRDASVDLTSPFSSLKRSTTNPLGTNLGGSNSPWASSPTSAFSAFGNFALGSVGAQTSVDKKSTFGGTRGESRFKNLLSKSSSEDIAGISKDKPSASGLDRLTEIDDDLPHETTDQGIRSRQTRSETNPFSEELRSGSAALGGHEIGTPASGVDQFGLPSSFGLVSTPGMRDFAAPAHQTPGHSHLHEPMSPTNTNPYQSPYGGDRVESNDIDTDGSDIHATHLSNLGELRDESAPAPFGSIGRGGIGTDLHPGDRSQTSSVGANRGFPNISGIGNLPSFGNAGWPTSSATGTPTRERSAFAAGFGDPIFGSMADLQSPSVATLGGGSIFGSQTNLSSLGSAPRASKLGSLFPPAMQDQMRNDQLRAEESMSKAQDPFMSPDISASLGHPTPLGTSQTSVASPPGSIPIGSAQPLLDGNLPQSNQNVNQPPGSSSSQLPPAQQRQMVMPDRMRWIYRDPQGNTQGPWSGLEMHDWFKAGFFTAELQVKKLEDGEYEPLAQLVRRIGNSREPFLVPQIGVPHGISTNQPAPWGTSVPSQGGAVQPPFANSFPSFGTTLTAEQQNALERRKQEEQYLMARQKEHLAQQQALLKMQQIPGASHSINTQQLQHHSSAQSLHSQPSYSSITSPTAYQSNSMQAPIQPPQSMPGFFEPQLRQNAPQGPIGEFGGSQDELPGILDRLNINRSGQYPFSNNASFAARQAEAPMQSQQAIANMIQERARLQQEQEQFNKTHPDSMFDQQARDERLRQFHALRNTEDDIPVRRSEEPLAHAMAPQPHSQEVPAGQKNSPGTLDQSQYALGTLQQEQLTLTQQVQNAATAQRLQQQHHEMQTQTTTVTQTESAWAKVDNGLPQPFPPPPSTSPLPAPAAQRNRQNVADNLAAETRSQTQTPNETIATSVAPWAQQHSDAPKGPSLREIQEAEARKAARLEEVAAAARRALAEQERANLPQAPSPGLPSTANWARAGSATTPSVEAPWAKPAGGKSASVSAATAPKKTLAVIQKEEEARKQRNAAAAAANTQAAAAAFASTPGGKRYAELAGKIGSSNAPSALPIGGAWTTVGAGGKAKASAVPASNQRSVPGLTPSPQPVAKPKPGLTPRAMSVTKVISNPNRPAEELAKWAKMALEKGLNSSINVDDFVQQLLFLPPETEIISDSVYANSQTLDGRRFADEFVRRRKLADKGIVDPASSGFSAFGPASESKNTSDGWNEVAKKGNVAGNREDTGSSAAFKVVSKKKGKR
ncbi:hypothetical protein FQN57_002835 [Myotisia sp. PD_48]|nr:hypothetical protein FQN57_002835 [Myotisia sp. PD_48]